MSWFSPIPQARFDSYAAAHLLWRAGFGGTWEEAEALGRLGLKNAVDKLVDFPAAEATPEPDFVALPEAVENGLTKAARASAFKKIREEEGDQIKDLKFWWLSRMLTTARPLEEKMTLFWHSHFASSFNEKIQACYPMWVQNETFRQHALAPFPVLLGKVIRDPAMLVWLDNAESRGERPNENFARELMELFTLGVGNYGESDVKAGARSLTGYTVDRGTWTFHFQPDWHDAGEKTYLKQTGAWNGDDVVRILTGQEACARFMARKYLEFFVYQNPEPDLLDAAAALYRSVGCAPKPFLHALFQSEVFYSAKAMDAIVKSPVVLAIGALKAMRVPVPEKEVLADALRLMGQDLFFPPDVNGWPGGMAWINSNMLLMRYNFANFLLNGVSVGDFKMFNRKTAAQGERRREFVEHQRDDDVIAWKPRAQLRELGVDRGMMTTANVVDYYIRDFLQRKMPTDLHRQFEDFLETDAAGGHRSFSMEDSNFDERVRGLAHLIMSSPDYQLC